MSFIEFESSRVKEKKRQWEREAREAILEKAKNKYEAHKLKDEIRRQKGEHEWMLPSVKEKIHSEDQEKKHKKKKKKKDKKKKKKKSKDKDTDSSTSSDSDENEMWVEKPSTSVPDKSADSPTSEQLEISKEPSKRDGWMEMTSLFKTYSRDQIKEMDGTSRKKEKEEERRRKEEADKPGSHARELNPYYKDGGSGLPEEEQKINTPSSPVVGLDATWLRKALQRAKEQALTEKKTLEEIATQRWGSLEKFNELLAEAEGREANRSRNTWSQKNEEWRRRSLPRDRNYMNRERKTFREEKSWSRDRGSKNRGRRSRSRDRRDRSRDRRDRSRDWKRSLSRGRSESKERSQGRERKSHGRRHSSSSSSSSSSRSSTPSKDIISKERTYRNEVYSQPSADSLVKSVLGLMKPADVECDRKKSSLLAGKFHRPGELEPRSSSSRMPLSSNRGWQKKSIQEQQKSHDKSKEESSSSTSETSDEESNHTTSSPQEKSSEPVAKSEASVFLTDKEMNELGAKIVKAELVGNDILASKLKSKLEAARNTRVRTSTESETQNKESNPHEEVVVLTRTDAKGFSRPVNVTESKSGRKKEGKMKTHGKDGQRLRYFPDDDKYDLKQMFEAEKGTTAEDQNAMFSRAAMNNTERLNDEYDMDDMFMSKSAMKEDAAKQAEREKKKAVQEHQRSQRSLESCPWCFENKEMTKHLIVALGSTAYVCLPAHESLTSGHCLIIPIHHVMCSVQADEDLWSEIQNFRKSLVKMFNSRDEDCIFFETAKKFRNYPHMVIHCVPLPKEIGDMAPVYFKKAIMECEAEWAQNKKLVDLKNRDVRRAVPKGLPYFFVDFAMDPGYAHVIEDEQDFPHNFAQEIVGGMLDLETNLWRKPRKENFEVQRRKVMEFSRWYKDFDITQDEK